MVLILDNFDSFTYNLYQIFIKYHYDTKIISSHKITIDDISKLNPSHIILSPGPGTPEDSGICIEVVKKFKGKIPILGVCLGHQAILSAFGVPILKADHIAHGRVVPITHNKKGIFRNIKDGTMVTRYHSLIARENDIPDFIDVIARSDENEVMAVKHRDYPLIGVQFHPESIGTVDGEKMVLNFLNYKDENVPLDDFLKRKISGGSLDFNEAFDLMDEITDGNVKDSIISSFLTAYKINGGDSEELAGFAASVNNKVSVFPAPSDNEKRLCYTSISSQRLKYYNSSILSCFLAAAAGVKIIKQEIYPTHGYMGNRNTLEKLGINDTLSLNCSINLYRRFGISILVSHKYHSILRNAAHCLEELNFDTILTYTSPLSNPGEGTLQIIGIPYPEHTETVCRAMKILGLKKGIVVAGEDNSGQLSIVKPSKISELHNGWIKSYTFKPKDAGIDCTAPGDLIMDNDEHEKQVSLDILDGKTSIPGELVCLNTGLILYFYGFVKNINEGCRAAKKVIKSGKAKGILTNVAEVSHRN